MLIELQQFIFLALLGPMELLRDFAANPVNSVARINEVT
jgi:hypothetical protein